MKLTLPPMAQVDAVAKRHHALSDQLDTVVTMLDRALGSK
jgi:hypothetical protein